MATGTKIGTAYFQVDADTTKAQKSVKDFGSSVDSASGDIASKSAKMSDSLKAVGSAAALGLAAAGVAAVGAFVGDSVRAFSELEQSVGGTEAVFGNAADEIDRIAATSASSMGLAEAEFRTATTSIGGQLKRMTGDVNLAAEQSVALTKVAADLAATYGGTTAEAVAALGSAFRGEADPAERFNLNLKIGAVNAKAVELGLAASTDEVDDNARAQATLALITEQSADAQGQFAREIDTVAGKSQVAAAELENMKARAGEALAPFKNLTTEVQLLGAQALGSLASSFQNLIGDITPVQDAINQFEILTGATADTLEAMVTINQETGLSFEELAAQMVLTADESEPLTQSQKDFLTQIGYTNDQIQELDRILADEHSQALFDVAGMVEVGKDRYDEMSGAVDTATEAVDTNTGAVDANITALQEQFDLIDGRLDTFGNLTTAVANQAEAQQAVNDAIAEFGEGSPEHIAAVEDLAEANRDLEGAEIKVASAGGLTREEFIKQQIEMGLTLADAQLLADEYDNLFKPRTVIHDIVFRESRRQAGHSYSGTQHGGITRPWEPTIVGEAGRELFVPRVDGRIIDNTSTERIIDAMQGSWMGGGGMYVGDINVVVQGSATPATAAMIGAEVEGALRRVAAGRTVR